LSAAAYAQYPTQYVAQPAYPAGQPAYSAPPQINATQPIQGVWLRSDTNSSVKTVSANADGTEIRVEHGLANVRVSNAPHNAQILVDLPGGQTSLVKDGLYTFNADTNTVRVLRGEADAYTDANAKAIKVKEYHQVTFAAAATKSVDVDPRLIASDILPGDRNGDGYAAPGYGPYGDGYYGYPVAPYPYPYPYYGYGYGYPYYGYPFGFGVGFGFGYYGGYRGGGYYRGGFHR
jgi:hypothetical protein